MDEDFFDNRRAVLSCQLRACGEWSERKSTLASRKREVRTDVEAVARSSGPDRVRTAWHVWRCLALLRRPYGVLLARQTELMVESAFDYHS